MKKFLPALLLACAVAANAADVKFAWDQPATGAVPDGTVLVAEDLKSRKKLRFEVIGQGTNLTASLPGPATYRVYAQAWASVTNTTTDMSVVRIYSDPSDALTVKVLGRSGKLRVTL